MSFSVFKKKDAEKLKIENFNPFDAKSGTKVDIEVNDNKNNENKADTQDDINSNIEPEKRAVSDSNQELFSEEIRISGKSLNKKDEEITDIYKENEYKENNVQDLQIEMQIQNKLSVIGEELTDENVTDIDWDGRVLAISDINRGFYISDKKLSRESVDALSSKLAGIMNVHFNRQNQILEANTGIYRISVWHESWTCTGNKSISIRKIPKTVRYKHQDLIKSKYAPAALLNLIENAVSARMNCVICGQPHAGKTEFLKFLTEFMPVNEKVGLYEENAEVHYTDMHPDRICVQCLVDGDKKTYSKAIKAGLKHNVSYIILSESRGPEVSDLVNALSTGAACMTTIHLADVRHLPDRMYEMLGNVSISDNFKNKVYKYIDLCVLVECDERQHRRISQAAFFIRENGRNRCYIAYNNGEYAKEPLPESILKKFKAAGINQPYE